MNIIERLKEIAEDYPNGFTAYTLTLQPVKRGWVVANRETQNCFGDEGLKKALTVAYRTGTIGGWLENERWYWDAVVIYDNEDEATKAGIENEQIAIYNIETNYLKFL